MTFYLMTYYNLVTCYQLITNASHNMHDYSQQEMNTMGHIALYADNFLVSSIGWQNACAHFQALLKCVKLHTTLCMKTTLALVTLADSVQRQLCIFQSLKELPSAETNGCHTSSINKSMNGTKREHNKDSFTYQQKAAQQLQRNHCESQSQFHSCCSSCSRDDGTSRPAV